MSESCIEIDTAKATWLETLNLGLRMNIPNRCLDRDDNLGVCMVYQNFELHRKAIRCFLTATIILVGIVSACLAGNRNSAARIATYGTYQNNPSMLYHEKELSAEHLFIVMGNAALTELSLSERRSGQTILQTLRSEIDPTQFFNASVICQDADTAQKLQSAFEVLVRIVTASNLSLVNRQRAHTASERHDKTAWTAEDNLYISEQAHKDYSNCLRNQFT
jgi:hypothetical protein